MTRSVSTTFILLAGFGALTLGACASHPNAAPRYGAAPYGAPGCAPAACQPAPRYQPPVSNCCAPPPVCCAPIAYAPPVPAPIVTETFIEPAPIAEPAPIVVAPPPPPTVIVTPPATGYVAPPASYVPVLPLRK